LESAVTISEIFSFGFGKKSKANALTSANNLP